MERLTPYFASVGPSDTSITSAPVSDVVARRRQPNVTLINLSAEKAKKILIFKRIS